VTPAAASDLDEAGRQRFTLPRRHRLKRRSLIRPLFDRGRSDLFSIPAGSVRAVYRFASPEEHRDRTSLQVGVFVSRRIGGAVARNRIRRKMREAYRRRHAELRHALDGRPGLMTLALVFRGKPDISLSALVQDIDTIVDRLLTGLK
jgi:ribonuclease P protein component